MKSPLTAGLVAGLVAVALAGCAQPESGIDIQHVHGLAYDPGADTVFVATHHGLARGVRDGDACSWSYVGDRYDYMGFTQDAERPGVFYSSGHPDHPSNYGGVHLGLRRSVDGGQTWEQRSLKGEVDFHALTSIPGAEGWLAGHWQGAVKVSRDGGDTWTDHAGPPAQVISLAGAPGRLLAGTTAGLYEADPESLAWAPVEAEGLPAFVSSITAGPDGQTLYASTGNGRSGSSYRSLDGGATWTELTHAALRDAAAPVLFAVDREDASHALASTGGGHVLESRDHGATWVTVRA